MKRPGYLPRIPSSFVVAALLVALTAPVTAWGADQEPTAAPQASKDEATEAKPAPRDAGSRATSEAEKASARQAKARTNGHPSIADRLAALAQLWSRVADAARKAAELELEADAIERETLELEAQARRGASLVEQTEARRARALGRLQELGLAQEIENPVPAPAVTPDPKAEGAAQ